MASPKRSHEGDDSKDQNNKRTSRKELTADDDSASDTLVSDSLEVPAWHWNRDPLRTEKMCLVSLWTRPLNAAALNAVLKLIKGEKYSNTQVFDHWALVFHWDDILEEDDPARAVTYEAVKEDNLLTPRWREGYPKEANWRCYREAEKTIMLSPDKINKAAEFHELNEKEYNPVHMNCQLWVKALWKALVGEILDFEDLASSSFKITKDVVDYAGGS